MRKIYIAIYSLIFINFIGIKIKLKKNKTTKYIKQQRLLFANKILNLLKIKIKIINKENLKEVKQIIIISNHRSILDPIIIEKIIEQSEITYGEWIAKEELYNSLFFGMFVRNTGTITVSKNKKESIKFFKKIKEAVQKGNSIFIFPEGTRNNKIGIENFQGGINLIKRRTNLNILPIYIKTKSEEVLKKQLKTKETMEIEIIIGEQIIDISNIEENYIKQFNLKR